MTARPRRRGNPEAGFTLIEIVVAFAVAALLLGALYQIFSTALRSGATAEHYSRAVLLAESALEASGAALDLAALDELEQIGGRYERRTRVRARPDLVSGSRDGGVMLYEVEVSVTWNEGPRTRSVELSSLRLGAAR
jgi:general secretion pathway protein I